MYAVREARNDDGYRRQCDQNGSIGDQKFQNWRLNYRRRTYQIAIKTRELATVFLVLSRQKWLNFIFVSTARARRRHYVIEM